MVSWVALIIKWEFNYHFGFDFYVVGLSSSNYLSTIRQKKKNIKDGIYKDIKIHHTEDFPLYRTTLSTTSQIFPPIGDCLVQKNCRKGGSQISTKITIFSHFGPTPIPPDAIPSRFPTFSQHNVW